MRTKNTWVALAAVAFLAIPAVSFASDVIDQDVSPRVKKIYLEPEQTLWDKGDWKSLAAVSLGYDNNAFLDSRRVGGAYTQEYFSTSFASPLSDRTEYFFDYEVMNLSYFDIGRLNLISNGIFTGLEHRFDKNISLTGGYGINVIEYFNTGTDDYVEQLINLKLKQTLPQKMFHSLRYDGSYRNYAKRFNRGSNGAMSTKKRDDVRDTFTYEVGKYFSKDMCKLEFEYYNNNSDEKYLNYYDYNSYRFGASLTHLFTEKLFGYLSASRQLRDYCSRTLINNAGSKQEDKTYIYTAAMFYSVNKSLSFGLNYTYRQNASNEPVERYSGSLMSISTYYRF
jgi:hypothetical protein